MFHPVNEMNINLSVTHFAFEHSCEYLLDLNSSFLSEHF